MTKSGAFTCAIILAVLPTTVAHGQSTWLRSPDGRYEARRVGSGADLHLRVVEITTGKVMVTTNAAYATSNDVKVGVFSGDSKRIAAAYHYGHRGPETWIGVWDIETGRLVRCERKESWIRNGCGSFATAGF